MNRLELRKEESGLRYYLGGRGVHAGDGLELRVFDGPFTETAKEQWIAGRYEWSYDRADRPTFHCSLGYWAPVPRGSGRDPADVEVVFDIPEWAELRWPRKKERGGL